MKLLKALYIILAILLIAAFMKTRREYFTAEPTFAELKQQFRISDEQLLAMEAIDYADLINPTGPYYNFIYAVEKSRTARRQIQEYMKLLILRQTESPSPSKDPFKFGKNFNMQPQYPTLKSADGNMGKNSRFTATQQPPYNNY